MHWNTNYVWLGPNGLGPIRRQQAWTSSRVSNKSRSTSVAGALAGMVRESGRAEVQAIGAGAVNQATKAIAIARGYLTLNGFDVVCTRLFTEIDINGIEGAALKMVVEPR